MKNTSEQHYESLLQKSRLPFKQSKAQAWQSINDRIDKGTVISIHRKPQHTLLKVAAAVIILLAGAGFAIHFGGKTTFENDGSQVLSYQLPDGSSLYLNGAATVEFNKWTWQFSRNTTLHGEGFFEVKKGSDFIVNTPHGAVRVLGTSFNVKAMDNAIEVQCKTGKVAVDLPTGSHQLLPGNGLLANEDGIETYAIDAEMMGTWIKSPYIFEDIAIAELFEQLSREIGYRIEVGFESSTLYSGQFSRHQSVAEMMEIICKPLGFGYQIDEDRKHILILKK